MNNPLNPRHAWIVRLDAVASVFVILAGAAFLWTTFSARSVPTGAIPPDIAVPKDLQALEDLAVLGDPAASVAIIVYSDFQCPYCAAFVRDALPDLRDRYILTGDVQLAFRHLPLARIHPYAIRAAQAVECAGAQKQFWPMHDVLFREQERLGEIDLLTLASGLELDHNTLSACLTDHWASARVQRDLASAVKLGISSTPSFLIGRVVQGAVRVTAVLSGAKPTSAFAAELDSLLGRS